MSKGPPGELASPEVDYSMPGLCHLSATCVLFGPLCPSLGSSLVTHAFLSRSLGSRLVTSVPHCYDLAPLKVPQQPLGEPKCTILYCKTNDFAKPPVFQKCSLRAPLGPPRLPQGPPRAPQGRPRAPQGIPQELLGGALGPPSPPKRPPGAPSSAQGRQAKTLVLLR